MHYLEYYKIQPYLITVNLRINDPKLIVYEKTPRSFMNLRCLSLQSFYIHNSSMIRVGPKHHHGDLRLSLGVHQQNYQHENMTQQLVCLFVCCMMCKFQIDTY